MGLVDRWNKIWPRIGDASTIAWLWSFVAASGVTSKVVSMMPGGWHQPQYWALASLSFFTTLAICVTGVKAAEWGWKRTHPPSIELIPHGGDAATLEIRPSFDGRFYGIVRLLNLPRTRPFVMSWHPSGVITEHVIRAGDSESAFIAGIDLSDRWDPHLVLFGDSSHVLRVSIRDEMRSGFDSDLDWIEFRLELRAKSRVETFTHEYRFRLAKGGVFEIEEVGAPV